MFGSTSLQQHCYGCCSQVSQATVQSVTVAPEYCSQIQPFFIFGIKIIGNYGTKGVATLFILNLLQILLHEKKSNEPIF